MPDATLPFSSATGQQGPQIYVIAEIGVNHDGQVDRAIELVHAAAEAGADAVKFQWFHPERLLSNQAILAEYQQGQAADQHELLDELTLDLQEMARVRQVTRERGLHFVATLFSPGDAQELASLEPDMVKVASPDAVNPPVLDAAASLELPLLVSCGTCDLEELNYAGSLLRNHPAGGCLLQCVSAYPTPPQFAAINAVHFLFDRAAVAVGYSDHTTELLAGAVAVGAGAVVLEKHLTYDTNAKGPDHAASLSPENFARYTQAARSAAQMLGPLSKKMLPIERDVRQVSRQSLCVTRDLPAGHVVAEDDLTVKRPGTGLPAAAWKHTIGRRLARPVQTNNLLVEEDLVPMATVPQS